MTYTRHRHLPLRYFWLWVALGVTAFLLARPAYRMVKNWRSGVFVRRAEASMGRGDLDAAKEESLLSLQLRPGRVDALRVLASVVEAKGSPEVLTLRMYIVDQAGATDGDRINLGETALKANVPELTSRELAVLLSRDNPAKETYILAGLLAVSQQQPALAREWFHKALEIDASCTTAEINLARVELWMIGGEASEDRGLARLRRLALGKDNAAFDSLRELVQWGSEHVSRFPFDEKWGAMLEKHPHAGLQEKCLVAEWKCRTFPMREPEIAEGLVAAARRAPPEQQREAGAWLNHHRLYERTLTSFPPGPDVPDSMVLVQLDALAALGKWDQIRDFLNGDVLKSDPVLRSLYRARVARETGSRQLFEWGWRRALREADGNPSALQYLATYAERLGEAALAVDAYEALSLQPGFQQPSLLKLVPLYEKLGETRDLLNVMKRLLELHPDDTAVINDMAWLGLLVGDAGSSASERAEYVYSMDPKLPAFAATCALARLRLGKAAQAVKVLEAIPRSQLTAPGWQAVYAAALAASGRRSEGATVAAQIRQELLKPEEKRLLSDFGLTVK